MVCNNDASSPASLDFYMGLGTRRVVLGSCVSNVSQHGSVIRHSAMCSPHSLTQSDRLDEADCLHER